MSDKEAVIFIDGMTCESCVRHIESMLMQKVGVKHARVCLELKFAYVCYDFSVTSADSLAEVVDDIGFTASLDDCETLTSTWINVNGMTCQSCVRHIEGTVRDVIGVRLVYVSLSEHLATVVYDRLHTTATVLCNVINDIGFEAELLPDMAVCQLSGSNCVLVNSGDEFTQLAATRTNHGQQTCEISVEGMTCNSCVKHIESVLSSVGGIISVHVSLEEKIATVVFNPLEIVPEAIAERVDDLGFEAAVLAAQSRTPLVAGKW